MKNNATNSPVLTLVYGAAIAAIYVVLTMVFLPISFGPIQFRISELLCVLPYFTPAAIPGLFIGCLLANFLGGAAALDVAVQLVDDLEVLAGVIGIAWHEGSVPWAFVHLDKCSTTAAKRGQRVGKPLAGSAQRPHRMGPRDLEV
mgnify:CR=1 FL=1